MQRTGVLVTAIIRHLNVFAKFCIYLCSGGKTSIKNERAYKVSNSKRLDTSSITYLLIYLFLFAFLQKFDIDKQAAK